MRSFAFAAVASGLLLLSPAAAFAQDTSAPVPCGEGLCSGRVPGFERPAPRLRFDVAGGAAYGFANSPQRVDVTTIVPTIVLDLGVQLDDSGALTSAGQGAGRRS
jgi:hypothetical protein